MDLRVKWIITILVLMVLTLSFSISAYILVPEDKSTDVVDKSDNPDKELELIVHKLYAENYAKPDKPGKPGGKPDKGGPACYETFGKGIKWKSLPTEIVIDPANSGLSNAFIVSAFSAGIEEWDSHTATNLFNPVTSDSIINDGNWETRFQDLDGRNEMIFDNWNEPGVIAIAYTWGYFNGPPGGREIVEFNIMFDTDFTWGDGKANPNLMDLQNLVTHEVGHGLGLADVYENDCSSATMYGYSYEGDIEKRDLDTSDINGLQELYGGL
jgi:hypothetical protein